MTNTPSSLAGATLWDGDTDRGVVTLGWNGDLITGVEPTGETEPGELSVIPGLIDTHVHMDTNVVGTSADRSWPLITPPEERSLHIYAQSLQALRGGVTTMRDLASETYQLAVGRALDAGVLEGGRLYGFGPVGMTAGHGDLFVPPHYPHRQPVADSPDECRKLVRQWARAGALGIKIYTSGGVLSIGDKVGWRNQTDAEISATVDEAHALGMLVAAHTHTADGIERAVRLGADSIEHGTGMTPEWAETLAARNIPVSPTILIHDRMRSSGTVSAETIAKSNEVDGDRDERFRSAGAAGVRFVLGTDANGVFTRFGDQMEELRLMQRSFGWTAERTLRAGTSDAADAIGLGGRLGRIRVGSAADFVVMRGRPWTSIDELDTARIVAVVARGRVVSGALPA